MKKIYTLSVLFLFSYYLSAQCSLYPVSLSDRLNNSALVIEGEVLSQKSFWNSTGNYIYTSNLISIKRFLKGRSLVTKLEVITEGGEIDRKKQTVEPSLQLKPGDEGIFTLNSFEEVPSQFGFSTYKAYADIQGFILYDLRDESASEPFAKYNSINKDLYPKLNASLGISLPAYVNTSGKGYNSGTIASVTGFSPTTITAGTSSMITITGAGFSTVQGTSYVEFFNADDGGTTYIQPHSSQYISWSNTQIQVLVPTRASTVSGTAGTGPIRVTVAGSPTISTQTLTVNYGELNVYYSTNNTIYNTRHADLNGGAGITWQMYTGFDANTSAKTSFLSSLQTWRCNTYINWGTGSTTTVNTIAADGTDVVRFDIGSELPVGVLGRCTSYFSGCITGTVVNWYVSELDICFDDPSTSAITWQFGPTLATGLQYDFESVSLHELGHGHQLSHVINSSDVMHYSLSNAQNKRTLITDNINGGNDVMIRNVSTGVCGLNAMAALSATACSLSAPTASFNLTSTVCVGQAITFTDVSMGSPTSWSWTITGGSTSSSTLQNPTTSYPSAGIYSISLAATSALGTSTILTKTISVFANPTLTVAAATICSGTSTILTASGAGSYTWNPGGLSGATQTLSPTASITYTVVGSNGSCTSTVNSSITVISTPTLNIPNASICSGTSTLITASGASAYTWNPGNLTGASQNLNPSSTSIYTVAGTNSGCNSVSQITIDVTTTPTLSANTTSICSGNSTVLTASGAASYTWMPGNLSGASQNLNPATSITYTITGANGSCTHSITTTLSVTSTPTLSVSDASICSGTSTLLTVSGANAYVWMPGNLSGASQNLSPLSATVYTITGTIGSCTSAITTTVNVTTTPTLVASSASICPGNSVLITASGAASYTWAPGNLNGASQTLNPTSTTNYTIVGNNGNCSNTKTLSVHVYTVFQAFGIATPATICYGQSSNLVAGGGMSYTWTAPSYTANGSMPPAVSPSVTTIYDLAGFDGTCTTTNTVLLTVNSLPTVSVPSATVCNGEETFLTASGADNYTWAPGSFTGDIQYLSPSITTVYTVTGAYSTGCSSATNFTITVLPVPLVSVTSSSTTICSGQTSTLTATSGLTYTWSHGAGTTNSVIVSPNTTTQYTLAASNGSCVNTAVISVTVNPTPTLSAPNGSMCFNSFGSMSVTGASTYTWLPGSSTGSNISVGPFSTTIYTVTGQNSFGCKSTVNPTLTVLPLPSLSVTPTFTSLCVGLTTTITVSGANSYTWTPGNFTGTALVVTPTAAVNTSYTIKGSAGGCTNQIGSIVAPKPYPTLTLSAFPSNTVCDGSSTTINAYGANTYTLYPGGTVNTPGFPVTPSTTTTYTITGALITSAICASTETIAITVFPTPSVIASANPTMICSGASVTLSATGGSIPYTWTPGSLTGYSVVVTPTQSTLYQAVGAIGQCTASGSAIVLVNFTPQINTSASPSSICSEKTSTLSVTGTGITSTSWNPGSLSGNTVVVSPNISTIYTVTSQASNGCTSSQTVIVGVSPTPTLNINSNPNPLCAGQIGTIVASGANSYTWNPSANFTPSLTITHTTTIVYQLTGKTGSCTSVKQITVSPIPVPNVNLSLSSSTVCSGDSILLTASGAASYSWIPSNLSGSSISVSPQVNTVYTVTGTNAQGCTGQNSATVNVIPVPVLAVLDLGDPICIGYPATFTASGASNYTWMPFSQTGSVLSFTPTGNLTFTLTGQAAGCNSEAQFSVTVDMCEGLEEEKKLENIRIFPNPFNSDFTLDFGSDFNGKIELYNSVGQLILLEDAYNRREIKIIVTELAKGVYLLKIKPNKTQTTKIIKLLKD